MRVDLDDLIPDHSGFTEGSGSGQPLSNCLTHHRTTRFEVGDRVVVRTANSFDDPDEADDHPLGGYFGKVVHVGDLYIRVYLTGSKHGCEHWIDNSGLDDDCWLFYEEDLEHVD